MPRWGGGWGGESHPLVRGALGRLLGVARAPLGRRRPVSGGLCTQPGQRGRRRRSPRSARKVSREKLARASTVPAGAATPAPSPGRRPCEPEGQRVAPRSRWAGLATLGARRRRSELTRCATAERTWFSMLPSRARPRPWLPPQSRPPPLGPARVVLAWSVRSLHWLLAPRQVPGKTSWLPDPGPAG